MKHKIFTGLAATLFVLILGFGLKAVFAGQLILPQAFNLGPLSIRFYGLCLALAASAAYFLAVRRSKQYGLDSSATESVVLFLLVGGFVGARLYHVVSEIGYYIQNPLLIPAVWRGGLSIFGAILGGIAALALYTRYSEAGKKISLLSLLDWIVPSVVLGQIIGRFGNLFNYEAYGNPTSVSWKMFVPPQFRLAPFEKVEYFHPLFLYEAIASGIILIILLRLSPKLDPGKLFFLWLLLYNAVRFFLEIIRLDSVMVSGIRLNMIVAGILALIGLAGYRNLYALKNTPDR
ncbi:MAG: prolipoprotein diacylglyceryl transferase [bacterium]|nr:prolipoprotein diacylglyceryl transferase [bacterium]